MKKWIPVFFVVACFPIAVAVIASIPNRTSNGLHERAIRAESNAATVTQSSPKSEKPAPDLWGKDTETNPVTGVVSKNASLDYIDGPGLHVRQIGKVRECYVITRRFLETTSNMYSRRSAVAYRFDDGRPVKQSWIIGDSNDTLFYPGKDCTPFIRQVMKSQTLAFQYEPAETIPTVATFDLRGFPSGFFDLPQ